VLPASWIGPLLNPIYPLAAIGLVAIFYLRNPLMRVRSAAFSALGGCSFLMLLGGAALTFS